MDRGFNRSLALNVFTTGRITEKIVEGQLHSDEMQKKMKMRLGYMGHLTLIAEEVVKFSERNSPEVLTPAVMAMFVHPDWVQYVEKTLSDTRERDNAILGGVRPDMGLGNRQVVLNALQASQDDEKGDNNNDAADFDSLELDNNEYTAPGNSIFGQFGASSGEDDNDDDDDDDNDDDEEDAVDIGDKNPSLRDHHAVGQAAPKNVRDVLTPYFAIE